MEEEESIIYLCFIRLVGSNDDGNKIYDFYFTDNLDEFWGDNFEQKPAGICGELLPYDNTFTELKRITLKFTLDLAQDQTCMSMQDVIDGCCALGWENIDDGDYPEDGRIVFHYGEEFDSVEMKLSRRGSFFC